MADKRKVYIKPSGYSTDHLIKSLDDKALLDHMGVPRRVQREAIALAGTEMQDEIEFWFAYLPHIFRPSDEHNNEKPELYAKGLLFYGPTSTGKTTTAAAVLLRVVRMGVLNSDPTFKNWSWHGWAMGRFVDWQEASELFRRAAGGDEEASYEALLLHQAMKPDGPVKERGDFLVVDDVSRERKTEFNSNELHRILRRRENDGFPTILTTNHYPKEWEDVYGGPMAGLLTRAFIKIEFA